jgi:hypothetical protein
VSADAGSGGFCSWCAAGSGAFGAFGLPPTNATVRTIARLVPATMNRKALRMLCWVLADDDARARASHQRKLPAVVIGTLASPHLDHVGAGLLHELADDNRFEEDGGTDCEFVSELLSDSVTLGRVLGRDVPVFHGLKPLLRFYEDAIADHRREMILSSDPLPEPPDVFTPEERSQVRLLQSLVEWGAEGRLMRHCLAADVEQCRRATEGTLAAWALKGPERLTFAVERDASGAWRLFDLKGEQNRAPTAQARAWADDVMRRLNGPDAGGDNAQQERRRHALHRRRRPRRLDRRSVLEPRRRGTRRVARRRACLRTLPRRHGPRRATSSSRRSARVERRRRRRRREREYEPRRRRPRGGRPRWRRRSRRGFGDTSASTARRQRRRLRRDRFSFA